MDIDLLKSKKSEILLLANARPEAPVAAIIFDAAEYLLSLELAETMETISMNIPVSDEFVEDLIYLNSCFLGIIEADVMIDVMRVPFYVVNAEHLGFSDTGSGGLQPGAAQSLQNSITQFRAILSGVELGQPVHRDHLDNENLSRGPATGTGFLTGSIEYAPQLARSLAYEKTMTAAPTQQPYYTPGMGLGSGGGTVRSGRQGTPPQRNSSGNSDKDGRS